MKTTHSLLLPDSHSLTHSLSLTHSYSLLLTHSLSNTFSHLVIHSLYLTHSFSLPSSLYLTHLLIYSPLAYIYSDHDFLANIFSSQRSRILLHLRVGHCSSDLRPTRCNKLCLTIEQKCKRSECRIIMREEKYIGDGLTEERKKEGAVYAFH